MDRFDEMDVHAGLFGVTVDVLVDTSRQGGNAGSLPPGPRTHAPSRLVAVDSRHRDVEEHELRLQQVTDGKRLAA